MSRIELEILSSCGSLLIASWINLFVRCLYNVKSLIRYTVRDGQEKSSDPYKMTLHYVIVPQGARSYSNIHSSHAKTAWWVVHDISRASFSIMGWCGKTALDLAHSLIGWPISDDRYHDRPTQLHGFNVCHEHVILLRGQHQIECRPGDCKAVQ